MTSSRRAAAALVALALSMPGVALAQTAADLETARGLYKEGRELRAKGDLKGALEKLQAAHAVGHTPLTGLELAHVEVDLGMVVEAREVCLGIARMPVASDESKRSADARTAAATLAEQLKAKVATVVIKLQGTRPGDKVIVAIDGVNIPEVALVEPRKVNPGKHAVMAHVEGGEEARADIDVAPAETKEVTLAPPPAPEPVAPVKPVIVEPPPVVRPVPAPAPVSHAVSNAFMVTGFSVGGLGLLVGAVTGALAITTKSQLSSECLQGIHCLPGSYDKLDSAWAQASVSTAAFVVGGAGLVVGVLALVLRAPGSRHEGGSGVTLVPMLGPGSVGATGAF